LPIGKEIFRLRRLRLSDKISEMTGGGGEKDEWKKKKFVGRYKLLDVR